MDSYEVILTEEQGQGVLTCRGEIDLLAATAIDEAVDAVFGSPPSELVIDLAGTTFLDSSGLSCLLRIHNVAADKGTVVSLRPGPPNVMRVLSIVGLDALFPHRN